MREDARDQRTRNERLSVGIPTYQRGEALLATVASLQAGSVLPLEIVVVDQSETHPPEAERALAALAEEGVIRLLHQGPPGVSGARNRILREARGEVVLLLDDDVICDPALLECHLRHFDDPQLVAVFGRVVEPNFPADPHPFHFRISLSGRLLHNYALDSPCATQAGPGGNMSVRREEALAAGGFDPRFVRALEETDFAFRLGARGRMHYDPEASLVHLALPRGGHRTHGPDEHGRHLRDYFHDDGLLFLRHGATLGLPFYLARQGLVAAKVATGRYARVFPGAPQGLRHLPTIVRSQLRGLAAALSTHLRR